MGKNLKVTTLSKLKEYAKGEVVELPPFAENQPFVVRAKRPSMMNLVRYGKIPNSLLTKANSLFMSGGQTLPVNDDKLLDDIMCIIDVIAEDFFIEPTYKEIKDAGVVLTDDQMLFVFNYSQKGVKALEPFRTNSEDREHTSNIEEV